MIPPLFIKNFEIPCHACGGVIFYSSTRSCRKCADKKRSKGNKERAKKHPPLKPDKKLFLPEQVTSHAFKIAEKKIMRGVWYA